MTKLKIFLNKKNNQASVVLNKKLIPELKKKKYKFLILRKFKLE